MAEKDAAKQRALAITHRDRKQAANGLLREGCAFEGVLVDEVRMRIDVTGTEAIPFNEVEVGAEGKAERGFEQGWLFGGKEMKLRWVAVAVEGFIEEDAEACAGEDSRCIECNLADFPGVALRGQCKARIDKQAQLLLFFSGAGSICRDAGFAYGVHRSQCDARNGGCDIRLVSAM